MPVFGSSLLVSLREEGSDLLVRGRCSLECGGAALELDKKSSSSDGRAVACSGTALLAFATSG